MFGSGGIGIGARGWSGANVPAPAPAPPSPLATQAQQIPVLILAEKLLPIVQTQAVTLDVTAYKQSLTAPQLRVEVATAQITLGGTMRLTGTSPAITLTANTGTLTYTGAAVPGIKVEIQSSTTFRISYNGGSTWDASGITIPTGSTYDVPGGKPAAGNRLSFASGTYVAADTYAATVQTIRSTEGTSYTFTNATAGLQPVYRHASDPANPAAFASLYFGGAQYLTSSDAAVTALFTGDPALTVIGRIAYSVVDATGTWLSAADSTGTNNKRRYGQINTGAGRENQVWVNSAAGVATPALTSATDPLTGGTSSHTVCWFGPGSNGSINLQINGGTDTQIAANSNILVGGATLIPNRVTLGAVHDNSADTFLTGHIFDLAVFSSQLGGSDRGAWHTEMST